MKTSKKILKVVALVTFASTSIGLSICPTSYLNAQGVGINPSGNAPNSSAGLDVNFSNKGILIPRVALQSAADASTIASPATSLLVYNLGTGGLSPAGYYYNNGTSSVPSWVRFANSSQTFFSSPANPASTTNTTGIMMGFAGSITPAVTGKVRILITGMIGNTGSVGNGSRVRIQYGTGTAPTYGTALTGTTLGAPKNFISSTVAGKQGFTLCGIATGLTVGTPYWIDAALNGFAGTAAIYDIDIVADEIQ